MNARSFLIFSCCGWGKCAAFLFNSMNRGDSFVDELNAPDRELICLIDFVHLIWQVE